MSLIFQKWSADDIPNGLQLKYMKNDLFECVKDLHAEPEDDKKTITRFLRALLHLAEDWTISDTLSRFRLVKSQKVKPPGPCLAIINDPQIISPDHELSIRMFGQLVGAHGGLKRL